MSPIYGEWTTQLYILRRAYYTTARVRKFLPELPDSGPKCNFFHLLWACPILQGFWQQVVKLNNDDLGFPVADDTRSCLPFLDPSLDCTLLTEILFAAHMSIARDWLVSYTPILRDGIHSVITSLPCKKYIYHHRGCPDKFIQILHGCLFPYAGNKWTFFITWCFFSLGYCIQWACGPSFCPWAPSLCHIPLYLDCLLILWPQRLGLSPPPIWRT